MSLNRMLQWLLLAATAALLMFLKWLHLGVTHYNGVGLSGADPPPPFRQLSLFTPKRPFTHDDQYGQNIAAIGSAVC
jgi:hypothetical protein